MAGEIQLPAPTGLTVYAIIRNAIGQAWRTDNLVFENYATANLAHYTVTLTEQGTASGYYAGTMPSQIAAGVYLLTGYKRVGGSAAEGDPVLGDDDHFQWSGSVIQPLFNAPVNVNQWAGDGAGIAVDANHLPKMDLEDIHGGATVGAAGYVGIDWGHVNAPTTVVSLSGTTIGTLTTYTGNTPQSGDVFAQLPTNFHVLGISAAGKINEVVLTDTLTTYTGNTPQTGDNFARLGAPVGASISADIQTRATPAQILTTALTESYAALGAAPTLAQFCFMIWSYIGQRLSAFPTSTSYKLDGATTAMTFTLDSATPTKQLRAS